MGLNDRFFDTQELGAADFPVVQHLHNFVHTGLAEEVSDFGQEISLENFVLHETAHEHGGTLNGFQQHIAGKAVTDHLAYSTHI